MTDLSYWPIALLSSNLLENPNKANPALELLGIFLIFGCVLYLAYIVSRFIGKKFSAASHSRHMQVVDRVSLGLDKHLILMRVGSEHYLFLSSRKDFKMVAKVAIDKNDAEEPVKDNIPGESVFDFHEIFDKYVNRGMKKTGISRKNSDTAEPSEKSEIMKENISRLKQMQEKSYDKEV